MPTYRTNRDFSRLPDVDLSSFTGGVVTGLTGNPKLPDPPVTPADLETNKEGFDNSIVAANSGGKLQTALKDAARAVLIAALNKEASYVDIKSDDDLAVLLSSGFQPVSLNRSRSVLEPPQVVGSTSPQTGQIKLLVKGDRNRRALQGRVKPLDGEFGPVITFKTSRDILFAGLTAGTTYVMQLLGIGGSTGQSDWSEPVTKIAV